MKVATTGEDFWSGATWEVVGETASHYWVGPSPRLAIADEASAYAAVEAGDLYVTLPGVRLAPFTFDPSAGIRVNAQVRFTGTWGGGTIISLGLGTEAEGYGSAFNTVFGTPVGVWATVGVDLTPEEAATVQAFAAAGDLIAYVSVAVDATESYEVSYIEVIVTGDIPLRIRQRGDGLGMGGPRVRKVGSRQGSPRVRGIL